MKIARIIFFTFLMAGAGKSVAQKVTGFEMEKGGTVVPGDTLELIHGSINNKQYRYVYINQSKLTKNTAIDSQFDGSYLWIREIRLKKNDKGEKEAIAYLDGSHFKMECVLKYAFRTGEIKLRSGLWKDKTK